MGVGYSRVNPCARAVLLGVLALVPPVRALERVGLSLGRVEGPDGRAEGVSVRLGLGPAGLSLEARAERLELEAPLDRLEGAGLRCAELRTGPEGWGCPEGVAELIGPVLDRPEFPVEVRYAPGPRLLEAKAAGVRLAGGDLSLTARWGPLGWDLAGQGGGIGLAGLASWLGSAGPPPSGWRTAGEASVSLSAAGRRGLSSLRIEAALSGAGFAGAGGRYEGQGLAGRLRLDARWADGRWSGEATARLERGQLYLDPVYLEVAGEPLELDGAGSWVLEGGTLDLDRFRFHHPGVVVLEGDGQGRLAPHVAVRAGRLSRLDAQLAPLYETYLQPFLQGSVLDRLTVAGAAGGQARWSAAGLEALRLDLHRASAEDRDGRFGLRGVSGTLRWSAQQPGGRTVLHWEGGNLFRVPVGAAGLEATAAGSGLRLDRPLELPILDGAALIERLEARGIGSTRPEASVEGLLTPVSMEALTGVLGWPPMGGAVSGIVPAVRYAQGRLQVEGALLVRAFDGEVIIQNLALERPLGLVPRLAADVVLRQLALDALTRAFSFGSIQGRLGGRVDGLTLERWRPVAFDARLETPEGDRSRRRISQRAVESLASLGGAGGVLSRSLLGLFQEFPYARLGIACRLRDGVCEMDGVAPSDDGYLIVQGSGIPRIDVVGYNRRVDWDTLVERLRSATGSGAPRVE